MKKLLLGISLLFVGAAHGAMSILGTPNAGSLFTSAYTPETGAEVVCAAASMVGSGNLQISEVTFTYSGGGSSTLTGGTLIVKQRRADLANDTVAFVACVLKANLGSGTVTGSVTWTGTPGASSGRAVWYSLNSATGIAALDTADETTGVFTSAVDPWTTTPITAAAGSVQIVSTATSTAAASRVAVAAPWTEYRDVNDGAHNFQSQAYVNAAGGSRDWTLDLAAADTGGAVIISFAEAAAAPTFTAAPAIGTRTTSSIPITFTSDTTGTVHGVAVTDGSGAPTCDAIEAETATGEYLYFHEGVTATVADSGTFSSYTDGTVKDGYFCIEDGSGNDSSVASIADMYKIPAFTVSPTVSTQDDNDYTISKTLDGPGTVYAVACGKDTTAPTVAQVEAGDCTGDANAIAAANDDATGTFTLGGALTSPVHDIYVVGTYGSQHEAAVHALTDECLDAASGKQYIGCPGGITSIDPTSFINDFNDESATDIAVGDILEVDSVTDPGAFAVTVDLAGNLSYPGDASRQRIGFRAWDLTTLDWIAGGENGIWVNNSAPVLTDPERVLLFVVPLNSPMDDFDLTAEAVCSDADADEIIYSSVDALPDGLSITQDMDDHYILGGTATTQGIFRDITFRCADLTGAYVDYQ